jgi:hypothetical protein
MIQASGLPKAPCYFLGRGPLDQRIGRVFHCPPDAGGHTIYYRSNPSWCECESSRRQQNTAGGYLFFRPPDDPCVFAAASRSAPSADRNSGRAQSPKRNGPSAGEPGPSQSGLPMPRGSACSLSTRRREKRSRHVLVIPSPPQLRGRLLLQNATDRNPDLPARSATRRGRSDRRLPTAQSPAAVLWRSRSARRSTRPGARSASKPEAPRRPR